MLRYSLGTVWDELLQFKTSVGSETFVAFIPVT